MSVKGAPFLHSNHCQRASTRESGLDTRMAKRGRPGGFVMDDSHRTKIANSQILNRLIGHVEGDVEMTSTQVTAGIALLKKVMPDMTDNMVRGDADAPILHVIERRIVKAGD